MSKHNGYMKGKWGRAFSLQLIKLTINVSAAVITLLTVNRLSCPLPLLLAALIFGDLLFRSPFIVGYNRFYMQSLRGKGSLRTVLLEYRPANWFRAVRWRLMDWYFYLRQMAVCSIPASLMLLICRYQHSRMDTSLQQVSFLLSAILFGLALIGGLIGYQLLKPRRRPAVYLIAVLPVRQAFIRSRKGMKRHTREWLALSARFTGWRILCILVIPYFFAAPLFQSDRAEWVAQRFQI